MPTVDPVPLLTFGLGSAGNLGVQDPYTCGEGFFGEVGGGTAPYTVAYTINGPGGMFDLGSFMVPAAGAYLSPVGFVDYSVIPDGVYSIDVSITDSSNPARTIDRPGLFATTVTDDCPDPAAVAAAAAPAGAVAQIASTGHLVTADSISIAAPVAATTAATAAGQPKSLALTGSSSVVMLQWALLLIAIGALAMGSPWRRRTVPR